VTDWKVLQLAGIGVAPADAHPEVKKIAGWVTRNSGGHGAIREVVEALLKAQGQWMKAYE